jgi:hypothetical protein
MPPRADPFAWHMYPVGILYTPPQADDAGQHQEVEHGDEQQEQHGDDL